LDRVIVQDKDNRIPGIMIIGTATNGGWLSGLSKKVSRYIKVKPTDFTPGRNIACHLMRKKQNAETAN
jgi:hypothetical protein